MRGNCYQSIRKHIEGAPRGTVFAKTDFLEFGTDSAVRQALSRLAKEGFCQRILPGIFYRPIYSALFKKEIGPVSYDVAHALARNYGWKIVPSPIHAQNSLGLSTQVPAQVVYTSTGPTRKYVVDGIPIEFRHSRSKYMASMSYKSALVTNALQDFKSFGVTPDIVQVVSKGLSEREKKSLGSELHFAPVWLQTHLRAISAI